MIGGIGKTAEDAAKALIELMAGLAGDYAGFGQEEIGNEITLQKKYFESLMIPDKKD